MKNYKVLLGIFAFGAMLCLPAPREAAARPQYLKAFSEKYPKVAERASELKCGVCHGDSGKNKKAVSDYGKALGKALGEKNVKGKDELAKALDEAGAKDSGDGKTYKELLEAGTLPAPAK